MRQTIFDRQCAPRQILGVFLGLPLDALGDLNQALTGVRMAVEHHILHLFAQHRIKIVIHAKLSGIDDTHRQPGPDGVIQEYGMDRLAHRIIATERETHIRDAAAGLRIRQILTDPAHGLDEIDGVVVVFFDTGGNREDIGIENDVFRREPDSHKQIVGALADIDLALIGVGLTLFIKGHDDGRCAVAHAQAGVLKKGFLAFLHRDRIDDALALDALEPLFDHLPFGGVEHDGHLGDIRLGGDELEEALHRSLRIEHRLIHVDVDDLRTVFNLLARHAQGVIETPFDDHLGEHP